MNDDPEPPHPGMIISVISREDVIVMDPLRFLAAARHAYLRQDPEASDEEAARAVADLYDAADTLIEEYGLLASEHPDVAAGATPRRRMRGGVGWLPGDYVHDRPDGLSPAGAVREIRVIKGPALQDYGCAFPRWDELFRGSSDPDPTTQISAGTSTPSPDAANADGTSDRPTRVLPDSRSGAGGFSPAVTVCPHASTIAHVEWPFADERAFWLWASDPDAELDYYEEEWMLRHPDGLHLLILAAAEAQCPKRNYCANVLADYTCDINRWERRALYPALREAADFAARLEDQRMQDWAAHVGRLFAYRDPTGPVNRARAEQMATDLLGGPIVEARALDTGNLGWLTVRVTHDGRSWECFRTGLVSPPVVQIDRRTGAYEFTHR
ncbi:hypothetical protein ACFQS1_39900 [Paractinoplanes rhizophilus]|uniref:Uncharacterized protein n=1 Tax=Paractinoplanes rhizophilus TaxID=1416877 RepID=A0ABW2I5K2_9ACTN